MSRRLSVLFVLCAMLCGVAAIAGQEPSDTKTAGQTSSETRGQPATQEQTPSQPQIIVNPPAIPQPEWAWHDRVAWGAGIVLAVLGYVGVLLALRTLKSIDRHLEAGFVTTKATMDSANAALALAQGDYKLPEETMAGGHDRAISHHGE